MAKADLVLPDGTKVTIDGSADEVTRILAAVGNQESRTSAAKVPSRPKRGRAGKRHGRSDNETAGTARATGPTGLVMELRGEGYFKGEKRSLSDIQKKLEEGGHIYPRTTLSPILVKLVRSKELRRVKAGKHWAYTSS